MSFTSPEECSAADKERSWSILAQDYITLQLQSFPCPQEYSAVMLQGKVLESPSSGVHIAAK